MDVNISKCFHCEKTLHYRQAKLLPKGGGVCRSCATEYGYRACAECQDYFIPKQKEQFCQICIERIFTRF